MATWQLPGYDVLALLGSGAAGEVWRARDSAGSPVVLRRPARAGALPEVLRAAAVVRTLRSEHVVRVRACTDGVLVLDHAEHGALPALLRRRGALRPGEVVTVVAPLAEALAEAHARGLMHGRISANEVLLGRRGKPLLDGLGLGALHQADAVAGPAGDVRQLVALAEDLLGDDSSPEAAAVRLALHAGTAEELSAALLAACPAEPLQLVAQRAAPDDAGTDAVLARPRRLRRTGLVVGVLALVAVAALRRQQPAAEDWAQVVAGLDAARGAAFAEADPALLSRVYLAGSPALAADEQAVLALQRSGRTAAGLRHAITGVRPVRVGEQEVELRVEELLQAHRLLDRAGRVVEARPAGPRTTDVLVLRRSPAGWRIARVG